MGEVEKAAQEVRDVIRMGHTGADHKPSRHQLSRPPDLITSDDGSSYLLFECVLCDCGISLKLNTDGEVDSEFVLPVAGHCA